MYTTDVKRQTDVRQKHRLMPRLLGAGIIINQYTADNKSAFYRNNDSGWTDRMLQGQPVTMYAELTVLFLVLEQLWAELLEAHRCY